MAFKMIVSRFEKSHCPLKSSVPLPWQPNHKKTLPTGAISELMIQTREPIPTYLSSILLAYYGHGISDMVFTPQVFHSLTNYFVIVFISCWKWLGWNIIQRLDLYFIQPITTSTQPSYKRGNLTFGIDFCHVKMKSRYYLKFLKDTHIICSYSRGYRIK